METKEVKQEMVEQVKEELTVTSITEQVVKYNVNLWIIALPVMGILTILSFIIPFLSFFFFIQVFGVYLFGANLLYWLLFVEEHTKDIATYIISKVRKHQQ